MTVAQQLQDAREAYARRDWVTARAAFAAAAMTSPLGADDTYAYANCAWWLGDLNPALATMQEAYRLYVDAGVQERAALVALDIGYTHLIRGEESHGTGWVQRAVRLLEDRPDTPEHAYLSYLDFEMAFGARQFDVALAAADAVAAAGVRFADVTLGALGILGRGRVLLSRGEVEPGLALLDEAMVAAVADDLDPSWAGNIYCHLMQACYEIADLRRAAEWTQATARWCEAMPGAGPFMGICRVHRAQLMHVQGAWDEAEAELERVASELADFDVEVVAAALYHRGDLQRLRGDWEAAQDSYRAAHRLGRDPQPGMALYSLARGRAAAAAKAIGSALAAAGDDAIASAALLPAAVEILLAVGDTAAAATGVRRLESLAATYQTGGFRAEAAAARGRLETITGTPHEALAALREAARIWQQLGAPYEVARARCLMAEAYERLGDSDSARLEREAAADACARLGVRPPPATAKKRSLPDGLTPREAEVLALAAGGRSNQEIADDLVLSVRTVERHLATVYRKIGSQGPTARAAAVRYALREGLVAAT
jgi:ATP/maltotriose-dependent transcriptional regulator MalT